MSSPDESVVEGGREPRGRSVGDGSRHAVIAVAGVVFAGSLVPVPAGPAAAAGGALPARVGVTAIFHLIGYAALAAVASRAAAGAGRRGIRAAVVGVAVATAFGFGVELVQAPIPWRSFAWSDAAVNAVGAVVGAAGLAAWRAGRRPGDSEGPR